MKKYFVTLTVIGNNDIREYRNDTIIAEGYSQALEILKGVIQDSYYVILEISVKELDNTSIFPVNK